MAGDQGLMCKLINFKMKQHNAEKRAILRYVSGREKKKLQMTMTCYIQAIGGCTYATVFSSKKWRTLEDGPHQREKFAR